MDKNIQERRTTFAKAGAAWTKDDGANMEKTIKLGEDVFMAAVAVDVELCSELLGATQLLKGVLLADVLTSVKDRGLRAQISAWLTRHEAL